MKRLLSERAVSEIYGAILIALITLSISAAYIAFSSREAGEQTMTIVDMIRAAEKAQKQHLSLTYFCRHGDEVRFYIYNYGSENTTPKAVVFDEYLVYWRAEWEFEWFTISDSGGSFGGKLGESRHLGESFEFNWEGEEIFGGRTERVGYVAETQLYFTGEPSTVNIRAGDGMEVYIDGEPIFDGQAWHIQSTTIYTETISVSPGTHEVVVKWYGWTHSFSGFEITGVVSHFSLSIKNMDTEQSCNQVDPNTLVEFTLPAPDTETFNFILLTDEGALFVWEVST